MSVVSDSVNNIISCDGNPRLRHLQLPIMVTDFPLLFAYSLTFLKLKNKNYFFLRKQSVAWHALNCDNTGNYHCLSALCLFLPTTACCSRVIIVNSSNALPNRNLLCMTRYLWRVRSMPPGCRIPELQFHCMTDVDDVVVKKKNDR